MVIWIKHEKKQAFNSSQNKALKKFAIAAKSFKKIKNEIGRIK